MTCLVNSQRVDGGAIQAAYNNIMKPYSEIKAQAQNNERKNMCLQLQRIKIY